MTKIVDRLAQAGEGTVVICDFSPPRAGTPDLLRPAQDLDADYISVAYNPGKSTRANPVAAAHWIETNTDKDAVFTLATRDMNRLAIKILYVWNIGIFIPSLSSNSDHRSVRSTLAQNQITMPTTTSPGLAPASMDNVVFMSDK